MLCLRGLGLEFKLLLTGLRVCWMTKLTSLLVPTQGGSEQLRWSKCFLKPKILFPPHNLMSLVRKGPLRTGSSVKSPS